MSPTSRKRSIRTIALVAAAALSAMVAALLVPMAANAAPAPISGIVHGPDGKPLAGVVVRAVSVFYDGEESINGTTTSSSTGAFSFASLTSATSTLWFGATSKTFAQFLGQTSNEYDAQVLSWNDGKQVYVQAALAASGSISGKVTRLPSGNLAGYTVRAYSQDTSGTWAVAATVKTSSTGAYSFTGLEPGGYRLEAIDLTSAHPLYSPSFSGGSTDLTDATTVGVLAGKAAAYNFALGKAGTVSGTVTGLHASLTENLSGVRVVVYRLTGTPGLFTAGTALDSPGSVTASNGTYSVSGLAPGYYTLQFAPSMTAPLSPSGTQYGSTFLGSSDDPTTASYVQIANGTVSTGQNVQLTAGATITGTVVDAADNVTPVSNIRVSADYIGRDHDDPAEQARAVDTAPDGSFTISGLGPGTYDLWVGSLPGTGPDSGHENQLYVRQIIPVPTPLASGDVAHVNPEMTSAGGGLYNTVSPTINQASAVIGDTLSVDPGTWTAPDATFSYEWLRSTSQTVIKGATQSTYTLQPADIGQYIHAIVKATSFGYGQANTPTAGVVPNDGTMPDPSVAPTISGVTAVGQTLTANPGTWPLSGTTFGFQWQVFAGSAWIDMDSGTGRTVVVNGDDYSASAQIRVIVTGMKEGYFNNAAIAIDGDPVSTTPIQLVTAPTIKKTSAGYSIVGGVWNPAAFDNQTVSWTVMDRSGASTSYSPLAVLPPADYTAGDYITAAVSHHRDGWTDAGTGTLVAQVGTAPIPTGTTAVFGGTVAQVGNTLTAPSPSWVPASGASIYQWQYLTGSTWKSITGATAVAYLPVASYVGHALRVITTRKDVGFATATFVSAATAKVALATKLVVVHTGFTGTLGTGDTVTEGLTWSPAPTTRTYQWEYSATSTGAYTKISKATGASYVIPASLVGKYLEVVEDAALAGHAASTPFAFPLGQIHADKLTLLTTPKITHVGAQFTATGATFSPAIPAGDVEYHWKYYDENDANLVDDSGSSPATRNLAAHPQSHWVLTLVVLNTGGYTYASTTPILVQLGSTVPSGAITLPASQVGQTIVPSTISWLVQSPTLKYQWQYESGTTWKSIAASAGGTAATFTPSSTYNARHVRVITTASRTNYTTVSVTSGTTTPTAGAAPIVGTGVDAPGIDGYGVGSVWTAVPGTWNVPGLTYQYTWASSASPTGPWTTIMGATAVTYTPADNLYQQYLRVTIRGSKTGYLPGTGYAVSAQLQPGQLRVKVAPKVTLSAGTYTVSNPGTWVPAATGYSFDWELFDPATDASTPEGTLSSYKPLAADAGKEITLTVYPSRLNYNGGLGSTITVRSGAMIAPTAAITLTGTPIVGGTLTIGVPGWNTVNPYVQVTWYRNGVATGTNVNLLTYTSVAADVGKTITAKVTATKDGYPTYTATFASSGPTFSDVALSTTVDPEISGTPQVSHVVTASSGTWNVAGLTYAYQWYRSGVLIPGATASSYLLAGPDYGSELTVSVTGSKAFYTSATDLSQAVTVDTGAYAQNSLASPLTVTGPHTLNSVLTVSVNGTWNTPVTVTLQWWISHDNGATWIYLNGQSGTTLALTAANGVAVGDKVQADVTALAPGYLEYEGSSVIVTVS
ncbi:MAG TPA: hypothetical protein VHZ81_02230 [Galbitalea sp.]|nr:hypothetical protein [Galbitalea sp.]